MSKFEAVEKQETVEDKGFHLKIASYFVKRALPFCKGRILDLGCGVGVISLALADAGFKLVGVDGNKAKIEIARKKVPNAKFIIALFEEFALLDTRFDTVIAKNVLEHLTFEEADAILKRIMSWLNPKGILIAYVPNALSLNRRVGYRMGISSYYGQLTEKEMMCYGHKQPYTRQKLELQFSRVGFKILASKGLMLKPFPNVMMEFINEKICDALFEVADDSRVADLCSGIFIVGEK